MDSSPATPPHVTCAAEDTITQLVAAAGYAPGAGLRVAHRPDTGSLEMTVAAEPAHQDHVVTVGGAQLFLDPHARQRLEHHVLDVRVNDYGSAFYLSHRSDHDGRADRAERNRRTVEALRAYLEG